MRFRSQFDSTASSSESLAADSDNSTSQAGRYSPHTCPWSLPLRSARPSLCLPYASSPITTNRIRLMNPSGAMRLSVSIWFENRMSTKVNAAFSSFCRFYLANRPRRYLHLEERHAQHDRHARLQRLLQTVVVVQHEHAERNVLPRCVSRLSQTPLSILFSACSTRRAHVNTPSGACDYA